MKWKFLEDWAILLIGAIIIVSAVTYGVMVDGPRTETLCSLRGFEVYHAYKAVFCIDREGKLYSVGKPK